jgi:hypothetical protein
MCSNAAVENTFGIGLLTAGPCSDLLVHAQRLPCAQRKFGNKVKV